MRFRLYRKAGHGSPEGVLSRSIKTEAQSSAVSTTVVFANVTTCISLDEDLADTPCHATEKC